MSVMDKTISMNVSSYELPIDRDNASEQEANVEDDDLWLIELDLRNKSAVRALKTDSLSSEANYSLFLMN